MAGGVGYQFWYPAGVDLVPVTETTSSGCNRACVRNQCEIWSKNDFYPNPVYFNHEWD